MSLSPNMSGNLRRANPRSNSVVAKPFSSLVEHDPNNHSSTPLRLFVDAKKKVNNIYHEMAVHVEESTAFIQGKFAEDWKWTFG